MPKSFLVADSPSRPALSRLPFGYVPKPHRAVVATGREEAAGRIEGDGIDQVRMAQVPGSSIRGQFPEPDLTIGRAAIDAIAVRGVHEVHGRRGLLVRLQW